MCTWWQCRIETSSSIPTTLYEFANGYNLNLTLEKFKLTEGLFDSSTRRVKVSGEQRRRDYYDPHFIYGLKQWVQTWELKKIMSQAFYDASWTFCTALEKDRERETDRQTNRQTEGDRDRDRMRGETCS